ncbi:MAG: thioredoxin domain-containing protein [Nanoarchaeota archaeon]|nr:thioredoxin domain-containing protein [Nanoarchaeota archaeon]
MNCLVLSIIVFIVLVKSIVFRKLLGDFWKQVLFGKQPKEKDIQTTYLLPKNVGTLIFKQFRLFSWTYVLLLIILLFFVTKAGYYVLTYGSCVGPQESATCFFSTEQGVIEDNCAFIQEVTIENYHSFQPPIIGTEEYPLHLIEFGCYTCKESRDFFPVIRTLLQEHPGTIFYTYIDAPLDAYPLSYETAVFTQCVRSVDARTYWPVHSILRDEGTNITEEYLWSLANRLSLDTDAIHTCIDSGVGASLVNQEKEISAEQQIIHLPTLLLSYNASRMSDLSILSPYLPS